jgi:nicotinamide-nucleotide amidase
VSTQPTAAILTIGTELTTGLRRDTNGGEIARTLSAAGHTVRVLCALPDDPELVESTIAGLLSAYDLVVVTGGLGPTHDDITREAAARALGRGLSRDDSLAALLNALVSVHEHPDSRVQMLRQADVINGAVVLPAMTGTAPGQVIRTDAATLILLPGPPNEMRPLLETALGERTPSLAPVRLRCTGITESDAQHLVSPAIAPFSVDLTLLAAPGDVEVILFARGGDSADLAGAAAAAGRVLGDVCFSDDGSSLAATVVRLARESGARISCAESCTGGLVAGALTDVPGASDVFSGGVVAYANETKSEVLGVPADTISRYGAVSEETARAMAEGALRIPGATLSVATTGIAGPDGGTDAKPVGLVWFAIGQADGSVSTSYRQLSGGRDVIRSRATLAALDLLRRALQGV